MGKVQSKQECFYVSADLSNTLEDHIWKKKTGFNLANYNMDETVSKLSICLEERTDSPLRVDLPPQSLETETFKLLKLDHVGVGGHGNGATDRTKLNIEEIECGLQLESSDNAKQEWSFTLYDFDGHGRITKEDLSSLLKALYDAVGSSIKLPPNGATTLKLRLSVGQDHAAQIQNGNTKSSQRNKNITKPAKHKVREFSKLNNLTRTQLKCTNENQCQTSAPTNHESPARGHASAPTNHDSPAKGHASTSTNHDFPALLNQSDRVPQPATTSLVAFAGQQQLEDLVQANIKSNQFRQLRKHHSDSRAEGQQHHKRQHRITGTYCPITSACTVLSDTLMTAAAADGGAEAGTSRAEDPPGKAKESQDRRNYYLDLAGIENNSSKFLNNVSSAGPTSNRRSRSHDVTATAKCDKLQPGDKCEAPSNPVTEKCDNERRESERQAQKLCPGTTNQQPSSSKLLFPPDFTAHARFPKTNSKDQTEVMNFKSGHIRFRPVSLPGPVPLTVLPDYHRRHRHREKDHDLAMQQVAQWIEREHACAAEGDQVLVQRHEHHHIHEHHHHHHFHHHHET